MVILGCIRDSNSSCLLLSSVSTQEAGNPNATSMPVVSQGKRELNKWKNQAEDQKTCYKNTQLKYSDAVEAVSPSAVDESIPSAAVPVSTFPSLAEQHSQNPNSWCSRG